MDLYDAFRTSYSCKGLHEMLYTFTNNEIAILEDFISFRLEDSEFSTFVAPLETFDLSGLYWDEIADVVDQSIVNHRSKMKWSNFGAFNTEKLLGSITYGSVYREGHGMGKIQSWKKALFETAPMDAIIGELIRYLAVKKINEIPHSVFCCYVDSFSNSQMKKGISWKGAATDGVGTTLNISVLGEFRCIVSKWENLKFLDLHLAPSTRQLQPCPKMFSNASKLPFFRLLNSGSIKGVDTTYNWYRGFSNNSIKMNQAPPAHPPPENDIFLKNNHMTRETSINSLLVTICMVATFIAALGFSSTTFKDAYSSSKDLITSRLIIAINTLVFIVSLVMDMFLLHKSKYKWELQITLFALFGAYICLMKVMVPQAAFPLFLLSVPFLFFAAA